MRKCPLFLLCLWAASIAQASVNVNVFEADTATPFNYRDIPVGTQLTFIVSSDQPKIWTGGLSIMDPSTDLGALSLHIINDIDLSIYPQAGSGAAINIWEEGPSPTIEGFFLDTSFDASAGDWFILDFTALSPGYCNVDFYDFNIDTMNPVRTDTIHIVPEPVSLMLLGLGAALLMRRRRADQS
jgi:hypothetical protein